MAKDPNDCLSRWIVLGMSIILTAGLPKIGYSADPVSAPTTQPNDSSFEKYLLLLDQIRFARVRLMLFTLQHQDKPADFGRYKSWEQFTQQTNIQGEPDPKGAIAPIMSDVPQNRLNGLSNVAIFPRATESSKILLAEPAGFILVGERIFATDRSGKAVFDDATFDRLQAEQSKSEQPALPQSVAIPSRSARVMAVARMITVIESQFQLYQLQHQESLPDLVKFPEWQQMTQHTDIAGNISTTAILGPYLRGIPQNPLTGYYRVALTTGERKTPQQLKEETIGFVLDPTKGRLFAVDENGNCLRIHMDDPNNSVSSIRP